MCIRDRRQTALLDQQTAQLKSELADLSGRLVEIMVTLRYQQLKSPVDGVVFDMKPTASGFTAQSTQTVMKIVPIASLEAKVEVPVTRLVSSRCLRIALKTLMPA